MEGVYTKPLHVVYLGLQNVSCGSGKFTHRQTQGFRHPFAGFSRRNLLALKVARFVPHRRNLNMLHWMACLALATLTACGGGAEDVQPEERRERPVQVALYGDSLTYNRTYEITDHKFIAANYAQWGQGSFVPLDPRDSAKLVVIRYGMADAIRLLTPEQTVENIQALVAQAKAKGQATIVVGMPCLDSELGEATAAAVRAIQDVDVTVDCGPVPRTTDGIHPTTAEHARMDAIIRQAVLEELNTLKGL